MQILSCKQEMQIINIKWLLFPLMIVRFCQINRVETVDIDKLCKFHENLTTNADCIIA